MSPRYLSLVAVLATGALAVTGCGSSSKSSSSNSTSTPAAASTTASSSGSSGSSSSSGSTAANPQVAAAVSACKSSIDSNPAVKANIKSDLEGICDKAGSGDATAVKKATKEVCLKIVESSVPAGSAQDSAKSACNAAS